MSRLRWALLSCVVIFAVSAAADVDFSTLLPPGTVQIATAGIAGITVNSHASITIGGITITGYYWNSTAGKWTSDGVELIGRNEQKVSPDHGIGICNPDEGLTACLTDGEINEISNSVHAELFKISKTSNLPWNKIGLSSLDNNPNPPGAASLERGQLFASNLDVSALTEILADSAGTPMLCDFDVAGKNGGTCTIGPGGPFADLEEPDITFPDNSSSFLYLQANNPSGVKDNDYLLRSVGDPTFVPEPGSLSLFATGLAAASFAIRRKLRG